MAKQEAINICQSTGKVIHQSAGHATSARRTLGRSCPSRKGESRQSYKCRHCGGYHVGRKYTKVKGKK